MVVAAKGVAGPGSAGLRSLSRTLNWATVLIFPSSVCFVKARVELENAGLGVNLELEHCGEDLRNIPETPIRISQYFSFQRFTKP